MKRQKIRKTLLLISLLLFPVILYYLSPYLIIQASLEGKIAGSFIVFIAMFAVSLFLGRGFCGWFCPAGGIMDCCTVASDKRAKGGNRNWIKYFIWVLWLISIVLIAVSVGGYKKIDFLYFTHYGISVGEPQSYVFYYFVIAIFAIMNFAAGRRAGCHYICWMAPFMIIGSKIKNRLKYPSLHLASDKGKCTNCKQCTKKCPMSLDVNEMVQNNKMNNTECILCGECIDTCAKKAIKYSFKCHD